ncbi:AsnC family transcriptional regulator [Aquifex pyrophilus]
MELLKILQEDIPILERPFRYVAEKLGIPEREVIKEVERLMREKVIRQISPIYDTKRAGYDSSLVAFKVPPERIESVAKLINTCPGVSHNYERNDEFNLWFTIATPPDAKLSLEEAVKRLSEICSVKDYTVLKTVKTFKIGVKLSFGSVFEREEVREVKEEKPVPLKEFEKAVIRETQESLPIKEKPFEDIAQKLGVDEEKLLETLKSLREKGVMRRFSAILFHRRAGFRANGMAVWKVEKNRVEEVGRFFSSFKAISHCYERKTNGIWEYNLFTMIHGRERKEVLELCEYLSKETGIRNYKVLFSTREFKKKRVKLFTPDYYEWEEKLLL